MKALIKYSRFIKEESNDLAGLEEELWPISQTLEFTPTFPPVDASPSDSSSPRTATEVLSVLSSKMSAEDFKRMANKLFRDYRKRFRNKSLSTVKDNNKKLKLLDSEWEEAQLICMQARTPYDSGGFKKEDEWEMCRAAEILQQCCYQSPKSSIIDFFKSAVCLKTFLQLEEDILNFFTYNNVGNKRQRAYDIEDDVYQGFKIQMIQIAQLADKGFI